VASHHPRARVHPVPTRAAHGSASAAGARALLLPDHFALEREVLAAIAALREPLPPSARRERGRLGWLLTGRHPGRGVICCIRSCFRVLPSWRAAMAFSTSGRRTPRVAITRAAGSACSSPVAHPGACAPRSVARGTWNGRAWTPTWFTLRGRHSYGPRARGLAGQFAWLVADDPRWNRD
jgi:hypothetical protein